MRTAILGWGLELTREEMMQLAQGDSGFLVQWAKSQLAGELMPKADARRARKLPRKQYQRHKWTSAAHGERVTLMRGPSTKPQYHCEVPDCPSPDPHGKQGFTTHLARAHDLNYELYVAKYGAPQLTEEWRKQHEPQS